MKKQPHLILHSRAVGPWPMNSYALICPVTRESVLIDPGAEPDALLAMLKGSQPTAILLTHTHPDHIGALDEMRARLAVPLLAHPGPHWGDLVLSLDRALQEGDRVRVGDHYLRVHHTPGHTEDMLSVAVEDDHRVLVGDTLFAGGPGKTWSSEGFQQTRRTLRDKVLTWPDDTVCYAGHGPAFHLGDIRARIERFLAKDHGGFYGDATWEQ